VRCNLCQTTVAPGQPPRWRKHGYEIFQCRSCALVFRGDLPTPDELLRIYDGGYFRRDLRSHAEADGYDDYLGDEVEHRLTARRRVGQLGRLGSTGRLLDVGAAAGFFIDEARRAGWRVEGIDVSPDTSRWGRERMGLEIVTGVFQQAEYAEASFDVVTMWDYIEHSIDPASDLSKAAAILRRGGTLMLSTGDVGSAVARICDSRWHLLTPRHHNFFFALQTLTRYLQERGFEITYVGHPGAYYSLRYMAYKLRMMAPRSRTVHALGEWLAAHSIGELSLPFNLGDIVTVHARHG
jgi:2-polyprenyl-3-methyl-5-hydroxy-6-metoxy-1,4-benzoquinol methylase